MNYKTYAIVFLTRWNMSNAVQWDRISLVCGNRQKAVLLEVNKSKYYYAYEDLMSVTTYSRTQDP